jgi:hypothetical protein
MRGCAGGSRWLRLLTGVLLAGVPLLANASIWSEYQPIQVLAAPQDINSQAYKSSLRAAGLMVALTDAAHAGSSPEAPRFLVVPEKAAAQLSPAEVDRIVAIVRRGTTIITDGESPLARALGITWPATDKVVVAGVYDAAFPDMEIRWELPTTMRPFRPPARARIHMTARPGRQPLVVSFAVGNGRCFYLGTPFDPVAPEGHSRYPYLIHLLMQEAGLRLAMRGERFESLFDYGFRVDVDLDYFAKKWRGYGVTAIHVGTWHFWDRTHDDYLRELIAACHRNGILVYAWMEYPEVSHKFWADHPQWREKNAMLEDAPALWRENMNLLDPNCLREVLAGTRKLLEDFDWDGANLCELYYEGPDGASKPFEFTPMNDLVRAQFRHLTGFDPAGFFNPDPEGWRTNPLWKQFYEYRADLLTQLHDELLGAIADVRRSKPYLDIVVTVIDSVYQPVMVEACGCDVDRVLTLRAKYNFSLIVEDPNRVWHLPPSRYKTLGEMYAAKVPDPALLGIDLNIVNRPTTAYPTKQQTGIELLQLFRYAGSYFDRVVVYIENTMLPQDFAVAASSLADAETRVLDDRLAVSAKHRVLLAVPDEAVLVDGHRWPFVHDGEALLPPGNHEVRIAARPLPVASLRVNRLTADPLDGILTATGVTFSYQTRTRAIAVLNERPAAVTVDGKPYTGNLLENYGEWSLLLPPGQHEVTLTAQAAPATRKTAARQPGRTAVN